MCSGKGNAPGRTVVQDQISVLICTTVFLYSFYGKTVWQVLKLQKLDDCFKVCVLLSNGLNMSVEGNILLVVWLLNGLWPCPLRSYGRHMHCQVPLGKDMFFPACYWAPVTSSDSPGSVPGVTLGQSKAASVSPPLCLSTVAYCASWYLHKQMQPKVPQPVCGTKS